MTAKTFVLGLALLGGSVGAQQTSAAPPAIALRVQPDRICADLRSGYPNFDLLVRNGSARPATAVELTVKALHPTKGPSPRRPPRASAPFPPRTAQDASLRLLWADTAACANANFPSV
jgi:hypothetical protein